MGIKMIKLLCLTAVLLMFSLEQNAVASGSVEGIVKAVHEVELAFQLDGVIGKIVVKEGSRVKQGEILIQLDDSLQKLEVSRREAVLEDRAEIEANKKNLTILKELLSSSQDLYKKMNAVSRDEVMNLEMQFHTISGKIDVAEARKKQEQIELLIAKEMLSRYSLRSPITGVITSIKREVGEWAKTGETIIAAADTSFCYAEFNIEESMARRLSVGKNVSIKVREGSSLSVKTGKVIFVGAVADKASALVRVKVEFENRSGKTVPGVLAYMDLR